MGGSQEACALELVELGPALPQGHLSGHIPLPQDPNSLLPQTPGC